MISNYEEENRNRLIKIINNIPYDLHLSHWQLIGKYAVGGLLEVGFSKKQEMLLVISSQGRGVFNCITGEKIFRDYESDYQNKYEKELSCQGVGPLFDEIITVAGINGGGLPNTNFEGDSLEIIAPNWPIYDMVFCPSYASLYDEKNNHNCRIIASDYSFRAYGFSWSGNSFIYATSDGLTLYRKQ